MRLAAAFKRLLSQPWFFTAMVGLCGGIAMLALYVVQPVALQRLGPYMRNTLNVNISKITGVRGTMMKI